MISNLEWQCRGEHMAQIIVRNIEDDVKERIKALAKRHGRSVEEEVRQILRQAAHAARKSETPLGTRIAARFAGCGFKEGEIPELRGFPVRPAEFK